MKIFSITNIDLSDFVVGRFTYSRNANQLGTMVEAIQVTPENIGMLAIDFETDLWYTGSGDPYFKIWVERLPETDEKPSDPRLLVVHPSDWLLPLRGEFHLFRHYQFIHTFAGEGKITWHPMRQDIAAEDKGDTFDGVTFMQERVGHHLLNDESSGELPVDLSYNIGDVITWNEGVTEMTGKIDRVNDFNDQLSYDVITNTGTMWAVHKGSIKGILQDEPDK